MSLDTGAGNGRIVLGTHGMDAVFSELYAAYPLKLLSPRITEERVAVVYFLTYGGGLVGGDRVGLTVDVRDGAILVMLSQVRAFFYINREAPTSGQGLYKGLQDAFESASLRSVAIWSIQRDHYPEDERCGLS